MEDLEQQLRNALARKDAPEWFEARVMAAVRREGEVPNRRQAWRSILRWRFVTALIAMILMIGGVTWQHQRTVRERAAGEAAKASLELALKITRAKLEKIERKLNEVERDN
jgi:hypothetical protein